MNKLMETARDNLYKQVEDMFRDGQSVPWEIMNLYTQFQILDKLEEIRICVIDVETEISKLNPEYK